MALIYLGLDEWKYRKSSLEEEMKAKQVGDVLTGAALSHVTAKPLDFTGLEGHLGSRLCALAEGLEIANAYVPLSLHTCEYVQTLVAEAWALTANISSIF